jgi:hypothetical protein
VSLPISLYDPVLACRADQELVCHDAGVTHKMSLEQVRLWLVAMGVGGGGGAGLSDAAACAAIWLAGAGIAETASRADHQHPIAVKRTAVGAGATWTIATDEAAVVAGDWTIEGDLLVEPGGVILFL